MRVKKMSTSAAGATRGKIRENVAASVNANIEHPRPYDGLYVLGYTAKSQLVGLLLSNTLCE